MEEKEKIKKLKCQCQLCETCLEKILKDNFKDKNYLNKYEMHNLPKIKCLCGNDIDFQNMLKLSKNKPNEKDKKIAEDRLLNFMKKKCCLCHESNEQKLFDFKILQGPPHLMCLNCYEKEQKKESNIKEENDKDSNDNIISSKNSIIKRKLFCKICYEEHIWIDDSDIANKKNSLPKLKCLCQLCETCLEKTLKDNLKDKNCLNKYEMHNLPKSKCLCGNDIDFHNLLKLSKNKPNEKDKKLAEDRLMNIMKKKCCLCHESNEQRLFDFKIMQGPPHLMCLNCYEKEQKKESNIKEENEKDSNDNIINNKNYIIKRKLFCKICYEEHIWIEDSDIVDKKNLLQKLEVKIKCCKDNCFIF
jgi:hypothetical protein